MKEEDKCREGPGCVSYSEERLVALEERILGVLQTPYKGWFVPVELRSGEKECIWTVALNTESGNTPLVLLHGLGAGVGFWCLNLDALADNRPVYAMDILGFGRSSRFEFSNDPEEAEQEFVRSIELWCEALQLDRIILLGHSIGSYLATSYAISCPRRVAHLLLADPWGFAEKGPDYKPPLWFRPMGVLLYPFTMFNPLAALRAAGRLGPWIVRTIRYDITSRYATKLESDKIIADYIYQCNSQNPTGETAFHSFMKGLGWARRPMLHRTDQLSEDISITVMFGTSTWMDKSVGDKLLKQRAQSYVRIEFIDDAGHHIHADNPDVFNSIVVKACDTVDDLVIDCSENKN